MSVLEIALANADFRTDIFLELSLVLLLGCRLSFFIADDTASLCYQRCLSRETFFVESLFEPCSWLEALCASRPLITVQKGG